MLPLGQIIKNNQINYHNNVDDTQMYLILPPSEYSPIKFVCRPSAMHGKTELTVFGAK